MRILFAKSGSPLSILIRAITREPVSHCAIQIGDFVVHSNLLGVHIEGAKHFRTAVTVLYEVETNHPDAVAMLLLAKMLDQYEGSLYDFGGFAFLGVWLILKRWFKLPIPQVNLWREPGHYLCTEFVTAVINQKPDGMVTPYQLYLTIKDRWRKSING